MSQLLRTFVIAAVAMTAAVGKGQAQTAQLATSTAHSDQQNAYAMHAGYTLASDQSFKNVKPTMKDGQTFVSDGKQAFNVTDALAGIEKQAGKYNDGIGQVHLGEIDSLGNAHIRFHNAVTDGNVSMNITRQGTMYAADGSYEETDLVFDVDDGRSGAKKYMVKKDTSNNTYRIAMSDGTDHVKEWKQTLTEKEWTKLSKKSPTDFNQEMESHFVNKNDYDLKTRPNPVGQGNTVSYSTGVKNTLESM